jgi:hypothetical protein
MNYESILARANDLYRASKIDEGHYPETRLEIRSDQVKSILQALVEAINDREKQSLDSMKDYKRKIDKVLGPERENGHCNDCNCPDCNIAGYNR